MKKSIQFILAALILLCFHIKPIQAQYSVNTYKSKVVQDFYERTTLIVLQNNAGFDSALVKSVEENWIITPYKFIHRHQLPQYIDQKKYSFLLALNLDFVRSNDISTAVETRHYLCILNGGRRKIENYDFKDVIAFAPFDFEGLEKDRHNARYRIPLMIQSIQNTLDILSIKKIRGNELKINKKLSSYYNRNVRILEQKTLLIHPDMLSKKLTKEDIKEVYPYDFIISNPDWIEKAIETNHPDFCFLICTHTYDFSIQIFDLKQSSLCYSYYSLTDGGKMTKKDFKRITKSIIKN
jgi:hypothetical protein